MLSGSQADDYELVLAHSAHQASGNLASHGNDLALTKRNLRGVMGRLKQHTTTWINGQRGTWVDPQADPSGEPQEALRKACAAWVVNNGCIQEFIKSVRESGYFMVLVQLDAPRKTRRMRRAPAERENTHLPSADWEHRAE